MWKQKGMATHSSILVQNPMDRGAWNVTVHRVAKSQTQLKQLSNHTTEIHKVYVLLSNYVLLKYVLSL